jgi:hypothetical protein
MFAFFSLMLNFSDFANKPYLQKYLSHFKFCISHYFFIFNLAYLLTQTKFLTKIMQT